MLYHQFTNQTKINELKTIPCPTKKSFGKKLVGKKCFAINSDDSKINEMLYSVKL